MARALALLLFAAACSKPEGGIKLTYEGGAASLGAVQKRLAALKVKGDVVAEGEALAIYLPGGRRATEVQQALSFAGALELAFVIEVDPQVDPTALPVGVGLDRDYKGRMLVGPTREAVLDAAKQLTLPPGRVVTGKEPDDRHRLWVLEERAAVTGASIVSAEADLDRGTGLHLVRVSFDAAGKKAFGDATRANIGRRLAIVLDGEVRSAPIVQEAITQGSASITLGRGEGPKQTEEAQRLAAGLMGGALPASLVLSSETAYAPGERR